MWQNMFWTPFLNRITFFKFCFKNVNVLMFSYFETNLIEKNCFGKVFFFKFRSRDYFRETRMRFWPSSWNRTFFECSYCWFMVVLGVYRYGTSFVPKFLRECTFKYLKKKKKKKKKNMVGSKWTPRVHKWEWHYVTLPNDFWTSVFKKCW